MVLCRSLTSAQIGTGLAILEYCEVQTCLLPCVFLQLLNNNMTASDTHLHRADKIGKPVTGSSYSLRFGSMNLVALRTVEQVNTSASQWRPLLR